MNCENCKIAHDGLFATGRFCSQNCASSFSSKSLNRKKEKKCENCNEVFEGNKNLSIHKKTCKKKKDFNLLVKDGNRKSRLLKEQEHRHCEMPDCMQTTWKGFPIPLQLDHIDGNPDNNVKTNLRLICPNCHAQTDTFCGKNVGRHKGTARQKKFEKYPSQNYR